MKLATSTSDFYNFVPGALEALPHLHEAGFQYIDYNFGKEYYIRREVRNSGYGCFVHDTDRVTFLKKMIDDGYLHQVLLSCDLCLKNLMHKYGGWGYDHVLTNIVPMMEDEGITADEIRTLLVENPANWLLGKE